MLEDSLNAWGTPNGWDTVTSHLEEALQQAKTQTEKDIPEELGNRTLNRLVENVSGIHGDGDGRLAELELLKRLKRRKRAFTIQGPASLIYQENGLLVFRTLKASETFSGKFLAYHVGRLEKKRLNIW
jgi:hypothetical protein